MRQFPIKILKECPYVETSLFSLLVFCGFGERVGFDMNTSHIFPILLAIIFLVGGEAEEGGARPRIICMPRLLLFSVAIITLSGAWSCPMLLEQKPWVSCPGWFSYFIYLFIYYYYFLLNSIYFFNLILFIFFCCIAWGPSYTYRYTFFFYPLFCCNVSV